MALPIGGGIGGVILTLIVVLLGGNLGGGTPSSGEAPLQEGQDPDAELFDYMEAVDVSVQDYWSAEFQEAGQQYQPTTLVVFEGQTQTGCGVGTEQTGRFYCPLDGQAYLDLDFFRELDGRFGAPGDFAQAYVVAHEYGHHIQNVLGTSDQVRSAQQADPGRANELSVALELQADCYAGLWAGEQSRQGDDGFALDPGDTDEGLAAASAVGDDRIQAQAGVEVNPESWTHGSAEQRAQWFRRGFDTGDVNACDTFGGGTGG
jgi:predicted metalloprotease